MFRGSWSAPLARCDNCDFEFEREPGYYLLSIWGGSYGLAGATGLVLWLIFEISGSWSTGQLMAIVLPVVLLIALGTMRHVKSLFLAIDLYLDPPK